MVLEGEVVAKQLTHPLMLRNSRQTLVQQELQTVVICTYDEGAAPKIGMPMADCMHQSDELSFVRGQFSMTHCNWFAEEGQWTGALVEDGAESRTGGVAFDDDVRGEVR